MKYSDSTISRIIEYALENRRIQAIIAAVLAVLALILGPAYPGGVGVLLVLLLAGLAAVLGFASAATGPVGFWSTVGQTCLHKPVHAMFAFYAFVLVVGQHPSIFGFAGTVGLTALCVYLGRYTGQNRGEAAEANERIDQAVRLLEEQGYVVNRSE